jgi:hypothetical protein
MRKLTILFLCIAIVMCASSLMAQNIKLSGPHYNLNIIGVENAKKAPMQGSERHTIFVDLGKNGGVATPIYLVPGSDFSVCDGNGFDAAVDCSGASKSTNGAVFQLPCNTNIPNDQDVLVPCSTPAAQTASYSVYARALGKPNAQATMTTCANDLTTGETVCSTENAVIARPVSATGNKPAWQNVTKELTSLVTTCLVDNAYGFPCEAGDTVRAALFTGEFEEWFWNYYNQGLRLAQLRFYLQ